MKFLPDRSQLLALAAVWLVWPSLSAFFGSIGPLFSSLSVALSLPVRIALRILQWNQRCLPSIVGMAILVAALRMTRDDRQKALVCQTLTLLAFGFTAFTMMCFSDFVRR